MRTAVLCTNLSVFVAGAVLKWPPVKRNGFDLGSAVMDGKVYPVQVPKEFIRYRLKCFCQLTEALPVTEVKFS